MEYRINPKNQNKISLLGMGCMRLPYIGDDNANIDYPVAQAIVDAAYAHGVNYFDTAYPISQWQKRGIYRQGTG
ncbi:MAG: hypothetical protein RSD78_08175 [Oscillospiraceae bacterium]